MKILRRDLRPLNSVETWIPQTRLRSSTGPDTGLGCRAAGSPVSLRCSICCGWSGWCRHAGTVCSEPSGSESPGCRRSSYSAPSPLRSTWTGKYGHVVHTCVARRLVTRVWNDSYGLQFELNAGLEIWIITQLPTSVQEGDSLYI